MPQLMTRTHGTQRMPPILDTTDIFSAWVDRHQILTVIGSYVNLHWGVIAACETFSFRACTSVDLTTTPCFQCCGRNQRRVQRSGSQGIRSSRGINNIVRRTSMKPTSCHYLDKMLQRVLWSIMAWSWPSITIRPLCNVSVRFR